MNAPVLMKQVVARIVSNVEVMPGYHLLCAEASHIASNAKPGQFAMVRCGYKLTLRRPLSIHMIDDKTRVSFLFAVPRLADIPAPSSNREVEERVGKGEGTLWLSQRRVGEELDILGPLGNGFSIEPATGNLLLVAGGIGVAPLIYLADQAIKLGKHVTLLLGAREAKWVYLPGYLPDKMDIVIITEETEEGSRGKKGLVSDFFLDYFGWADQICACGPVAMYQAMVGHLQRRRERKPVQVSLEVRMGCGVGACYGCSIKTRRGMRQVCKDGPVFDIDEILWQEVKI
jgi:dihydroorotate dehydrogenase electron transfer subunit